MKSLVMTLVMTVAFACVFAPQADAVGLYAVGKEQISCSPLVARGIVPDTWNKLGEALLVPQISWALDKLAVEMKTMLGQFGAPPVTSVAETASVSKEAIIAPNDKPLEKPKELLEEKPVKKIKKAEVRKDKKDTKPKKATDKPKKRIKVPPKAM